MHCKSQNSPSSPAAFNFQKNVHHSKSRPDKSSTECMYHYKKGHWIWECQKCLSDERRRMHTLLLKKEKVISLVYSMAPIQTMVMPGLAMQAPNSILYMIIIHLLNTPLFWMSTSKAWVQS